MIKKAISKIIILIYLLGLFCTSVCATEKPSVTAKLEQSYEKVTFENESGLEYYKLNNSRPGTYKSFYGIADVNGKIVIPCNYNYISPILPRSNNWQTYLADNYYWMIEADEGKYGIADKNGKIIIPCKYGYPTLEPFDCVVCDELSGEKYGFIFTMKNTAFSVKGKEIISASRGYTYINPEVNPTDGEKYIIVEKENSQGTKEGLCDANGKELLAPIYNSISTMSQWNHDNLRYFYITTDKGKGLYDYQKKQIALSPKYYWVGTWGNIYYFQTEQNGECKIYYEDDLIMTADKITTNTWLDNGSLNDKYAIFKKDKTQGLINELTGKVLPLQVDSIMQIKDGTVSVMENGAVAIYNLAALDEGRAEKIASMTRDEAAKGVVSDVDKNIPTTKTIDENTFAVIIANENYNDFIVPAAGNDGKIFKEYCISALGISKENIMYNEDATLNNIYAVIKRLKDLSSVYDEGCKIIFYYSGQGVTDERTKEMYLLPSDGTLKAITSTCYSISKLYSEIGTLPNVEQALFLIDAPFNGYSRNNEPLVQARGVSIKSVPNKVVGKTIAVEAAGEGETALVYSLQNHGLFTYYLLKAMQTNDSKKQLLDLIPGVIQNVKDKSVKEMKSPQNVQLKK